MADTKYGYTYHNPAQPRFRNMNDWYDINDNCDQVATEQQLFESNFESLDADPIDWRQPMDENDIIEDIDFENRYGWADSLDAFESDLKLADL